MNAATKESLCVFSGFFSTRLYDCINLINRLLDLKPIFASLESFSPLLCAARTMVTIPDVLLNTAGQTSRQLSFYSTIRLADDADESGA